jgi:hypothetical protein
MDFLMVTQFTASKFAKNDALRWVDTVTTSFATTFTPQFPACPSMTPCVGSPAHKTTTGVIMLRRQFGQKPVQWQNPGLTMPMW